MKIYGATNSYFLTVFEFSTTEYENRLRKVIDELEIPSRTVGRHGSQISHDFGWA